MPTIDTTTIDSNYPIAGQSNSTAGFRTNFAATKTLLGELQQQITDLTPGDFPVLSAVATSGSYTDLSNKPTLFSGSYTDLTNKPATLPTNAVGVLTNNGTGTLTWEPQEIIYRGSSVLSSTTSTVNTEFSVARITDATTATLAAPTAPQQLEGVEITLIKSSANTVVTVITVSSPGWTGAGTITLTEPGETATLINVNELWYIKSINGAVIA
jgi:hypothetical protein